MEEELKSKLTNPEQRGVPAVPSLQPESTLNLKHLAAHSIMTEMKESMQAIDDMINDNIAQLKKHIDQMNQVNAKRVALAKSVTSSGDGKELEVKMTALETKLSCSATRIDEVDNADKSPSQTEIILRAYNLLQDANTTKVRAILPTLKVDNPVMSKAILDMWDLRGVLMQILHNNVNAFSATPEVVGDEESNTKVVKVILKEAASASVLDFRTINNWLQRPNSRKSRHLIIPKMIEELTPSSPKPDEPVSLPSVLCYHLAPPNEIDFMPFEEMDSVLKLPKVCQLFNLIRDSRCGENLKELYLNAAIHDEDDDFNEMRTDMLNSVGVTLPDLKGLTKLVLRGFCEDEILEIVGSNCQHLVYLDISGSNLVTDAGIQKLVFKETNVSSTALYMIPTWIMRNLDKMNQLMSNLRYLDYSRTSVTNMGRKIFQVLPGCFLFKRLVSSGEGDDFGHHIFIREPALLKSLLPSNTSHAFEKQLIHHIDTNGTKNFMKLVDSHPWRNCYLTLYSLPVTPDGAMNLTVGGANTICGLITPNQNERRIQGIVQWNKGNLTQVYSIYPINVNLLASVNSLQIFRGIVHNAWKTQFSFLQDLTQLDIFTEPRTLISFMHYCPNLKRLRIRIRGTTPLRDNDIMNAIKTSMCRSTLQEFWIAPIGSSSSIVASNASSIASSLNPSQSASQDSLALRVETQLNSIPGLDFNSNGNYQTDLVKLSLACLQTLLSSCPKLKRVGDIATWSSVEEEELYLYCEQLKQKRHKIVITWATINLPDSSDKKKRTKVGN